jgi:hypothetical protein
MRFCGMGMERPDEPSPARPSNGERADRLDAASSVHQQRDDRSDQEHHEQYLCDARGAGGDPAEAEYSGNQCNDEKYDGIVQHEKIPLLVQSGGARRRRVFRSNETLSAAAGRPKEAPAPKNGEILPTGSHYWIKPLRNA